MSSRGVTISVTAETNAGSRRHMEDYLAVKLSPNEEMSKLPHLREQAYIGVFDGHGGKEAARCARERLWDVIQNQPKYKSTDIESIKQSLEDAYLALHKEMEPMRVMWKKNKTGDLSTAGTTASVVIFRQDHIFVANVGDSTAVLAVNNPRAGEPNQHPVSAVVLTKDHKPEDPDETRNIENLGGSVMTSRKGVPRVVWRRQRKTGEDVYDSIPFLSVSRSLGDFWSFNPRTNHFTVSPKPDVYVHPLNPKEQRFVVIASDGLWNVMTPDEVVRYIWDYEHNEDVCYQPRDVVRAVIEEALRRWQWKRQPADNIAVLIAFLTEAIIEDEPAPAETPPLLDSPPAVETPPETLSLPLGKHSRTEDDDSLDQTPSEKRLKISEPSVIDDDSGVCSDDNNSRPPSPPSSTVSSITAQQPSSSSFSTVSSSTPQQPLSPPSSTVSTSQPSSPPSTASAEEDQSTLSATCGSPQEDCLSPDALSKV